MDRATVLKRVFESAGIRNHGRWVQRELQQGEAGAGLELGALFCAIAARMLTSKDAQWLDQYASSAHTRPVRSSLDEAVAALARSNCDRKALMEVIRYFQAQMAYAFFALHDGMAPASAEPQAPTYRLACVVEPEGAASLEESELRALPNDLYESFASFLEDLADEDAIFDDSE